MKRFAEYIRVSTGPQAKRFGPDVQHRANLDYVRAQHGVIIETYQDVDSGAKPTRREFDRLLRDARAGRFDAVVAYKVGRVGRLAFISMQFAEELKRVGLEVHGAKTGAYNLKRPTDRFRYGVDAIFSEFEYENLIQNLYDAKIAKAAEGGLPQRWEPYGRRARYTPDGVRVVEVYEPEAMWVRKVFEWAREGMGIISITHRLEAAAPPPRRSGGWSYPTVRYMLHNRSYAGTLEYRFKRTDGEPIRVTLPVEPIIPAELFDEVQRALADRKRGGRRSLRADRPLVGLLRCGGCGWRLGLSHYDLKRAYFRCINRHCSQAGYHIMYRKAERLMLELVRQAAKTPDMLLAPPSQPSVSREHIERQLGALAKRRTRVLEMVEMGLYAPNEGKARIAQIAEEMKGLEEELSRATVIPMVDVAAWRKRLARVMKDPRPELLREAGLALVTWRDRRVALKLTR